MPYPDAGKKDSVRSIWGERELSVRDIWKEREYSDKWDRVLYS